MSRSSRSSLLGRVGVIALATAMTPLASGLLASAAPSDEPSAVVAPANASPSAPRVGPDGMVTVIVTLRTKADLGTESKIKAPADRSRAVVRKLRATALRAQANVLVKIFAGALQGKVRGITPLWVIDALSLTATPDVVAALAADPAVESITADTVDIVPVGYPSSWPTEPNIVAAGAAAVWAQGAYGQGVVIASLDSGVDGTHPALASTWRGGTDSWFDPYGQHPDVPTDRSGHGTATMGVILGSDAGGSSIGMAPGATWIAARIFDDSGAATATSIHVAMQWALDPDNDPNTADAPSIVNNSWAYGSPGCNLEFRPDVQAWRAAGIIPVFAAGNAGPYASSSVSPANYPESLAVGASNNSDKIYAYDSRGPSACGGPSTTYPDVVAPGVNVYTSDRNGLYSVWTGSSLAAPSVSGALALLMSSGSATTTQAESALLSTAVDRGVAGPDNVFGRGRIDVLAGQQSLTSTPPTSTTTTTLPPTTTTTLPPTTTTTLPPTTTTTLPPTTTTTLPPTTTTTLPPTTTTTTTLPPTTTTTLPPTTTTTLPPTTTTTTTLPPTTTTTLPPTTTTTLPPTTTTTVPAFAPLFADGFESGGVSAWSSASTDGGRLTVQPGAALGGNFGLAASIGGHDMFVADASPNSLAAYHARFGFDPNGVLVTGSKTHDLLVLKNAAGATVMNVQFGRSGSAYRVRMGTLLKAGSTKWTGWMPLTDAPHTIEVGVLAASTASGKNGSAQLAVDGAVVSLSALANGTTRVDEARLGPQAVPTSGVTGTEWFDLFTSTPAPGPGW